MEITAQGEVLIHRVTAGGKQRERERERERRERREKRRKR
jgi:hypothetical protein